MKFLRLLCLILLGSLVLSETITVSAKQNANDDISDCIEEFASRLYGYMLTDSKTDIGRDDYLSIDGYLTAKVFETQRDVYNINMSNGGVTRMEVFQTVIDPESLEDDGSFIKVKAMVACRYTYDATENDEWCNNYLFTLSKDSGKYKVIDVCALEGDWFLVAKDSIPAWKEYCQYAGDEWEFEAVDLMMEAKKVDYRDCINITESEDDNPAFPDLTTCLLRGLTTTVSYNKASAAAYGIKTSSSAYYPDNYIFCPSSPDCTNFVSQCVWAGYGGTAGYSLPDTPTSGNTDITALRNRVSADYRMVPGNWYGRYYRNPYVDSPAKWCGVTDFWDYAVDNSGNGPVATGFNNGNLWTQYSGTIRIGDVLQVKSPGGTYYGHSVIVTSGATDDTTIDDIGSIYISQHAPFYSHRSLSNLIIAWSNNLPYSSPCFMRRMRFYNATFSN